MAFTKQEILDLLQVNQRVLERSIIVIYNRQTQDEKSSMKTAHLNGRGFNGPDSHVGSYLAQYILKGIREYRKDYGNNLSGKWLEKARKIMPKYVGQLLEEHTEKVGI